MVKNRPTFRFFRKQVQEIFDAADLVVGYNTDFDLAFIKSKGVPLYKTNLFSHLTIFSL